MEHTSPLTRSEIRLWALSLLGRDLVEYARYSLARQAQDEIAFVRTSRSALVWIASVLTFPLGVLVYMAGKRQDSVTVLLNEVPDGTVVTISGSAKPRVIEGVRHRLYEDLGLDELAIAEHSATAVGTRLR